MVFDTNETSECSEERQQNPAHSANNNNDTSPQNRFEPNNKPQNTDISAPDAIGETAFPLVSTKTSSTSPHKYLLNGLQRLVTGIKQLLQNKKLLITAGVLGFIWLLLLVLQAAGISNGFLSFINFLTFSQGGASGGVSGFIGGMAGKGLFAYMVSGFFTSGFSLNALKGGLSRFKSIPGYFRMANGEGVVSLLVGASLALAAFNLMSGNASPVNSMAGITGLVLSAGALSSQKSFLRGFLGSLMARPATTGAGKNSGISQIIAGMTAGFALSVPLAFIPFSFIGYVASGVFMIAAVTLKLVQERSQNVVHQAEGQADEA